MELISVLLSAYNEPQEMIKKSVDSVLNQSYKNLEIILINDNPSNDVIDILFKEYASKDSRIQYIKHNQNKGLVSSLNEGIKLSRGKYIARMDADDISKSDRFERQLEYLKNNQLDMVGTSVIKIDEKNKIVGKLFVPSDFDKIKKYQKYGSCVLHPTWIVKKDVYENLDGYRDIYSCEDYDFVLRAIIKGYKIGNVSDDELYYRVRSTSVSNSSLYHQKIMTYFLANKYKKNKIASKAEVECFLKSDKYKNDSKKMKLYIEQKEKIKNRKYGFFLLIMLNKYFYYNLVEYYKKRMIVR